MTTGSVRPASLWPARLAWALLLLIAGAGLATWGLARWDAGARFFGVAPVVAPVALRPALAPAPQSAAIPPTIDAQRLALLESRLTMLERETETAQGSAGRTDALIIAFAARRAIERGVALGYLESLLVERFGADHQRAVATIVTAARSPVTQAQLIEEYRRLGPLLRGTAPDENWWSGLRREMGSLIAIRRSDSPSPRPAARYERVLARLEAGEIDTALAETMRLPGAGRPEAQAWVGNARRLILVRRALDEIESGALIGRARPGLALDPVPASGR